jgi:hypothetical protein
MPVSVSGDAVGAFEWVGCCLYAFRALDVQATAVGVVSTRAVHPCQRSGKGVHGLASYGLQSKPHQETCRSRII